MAEQNQAVTKETGALAMEMEGADFGDKRLSRRLPKLVERLSQAPDKSFPSLLDEAELEAAYRFFSNEPVTPDRSWRRMWDGARVGLGRRRTKGQVFFAHVTIAAAADGTRRPMGALAMRGHVRDGKQVGCERPLMGRCLGLSLAPQTTCTICKERFRCGRSPFCR